MVPLTGFFSRIDRIGTGYLVMQSDRKDGFAFRLSRENRFYYARDVDAARRVLEIFTAEGDPGLRKAIGEDPRLREQLDSMVGLGFFQNIPSQNLYSVLFRVEGPEGLLSLNPGLEAVLRSFRLDRLQFNLHVRRLADIPTVCQKAEWTAGKILGKIQGGTKGAREAAPRPPIALCVYSPLEGKPDEVEPLRDLLDRNGATLFYACTPADVPEENPALRMLENDGFLTPYSVQIPEDFVLDSPNRVRTAQVLERWLNEQPNREFMVRISPPSAGGPRDRLERYMEGLQDLVSLLYGLNGDVSRLSVFQRYAGTILQSPLAGNGIEFEFQKDRIRAVHHLDGRELDSMAPEAEPLVRFHETLANVITGQMETEPCCSCRFRGLCPMDLSGAYLTRDLRNGNGRTDSEFTHRCGIHQTMLERMLSEFLLLCREEADGAVPLLMNIAKGKSLSFTELYSDRSGRK